MCAERSFGPLSVSLRAEDEGVALGFDGRGSQEVIGYFYFLDSAYFDVGFELGVAQFFACSPSVLIAEEIKSHERKGGGIEEDAEPSAGTFRLIASRHPRFACSFLIVCHTYKISGSSVILPSAQRCSMS